MLSYADWALSMNHLVKGDKIIRQLKSIVPDVNIENLDIPFCAVAADLQTQREVVFRTKSLYRAIRASISIPTLIKPVRFGEHIVVDGGIANPLPLNRVARTEGDLLVSVNVSAPMSENVSQLKRHAREIAGSSKFSIERMMQHFVPDEVDSNYFTLGVAAMTMLIQRNTVLAQKLNKPDIAVNIPMNRFNVFDFELAERITKEGYLSTIEAIDAWEAQNH